MKTLTESLKLIQEHIDLQMYGHAWDKCQELIDAVNARDSEPFGYVSDSTYSVTDAGTVRKTPNDVFKNPVFTSQPNDKAEIARLREALMRIGDENSMMDIDTAQKFACEALAMKGE